MIFLFGKLPAFGDFVTRGLTQPMRAQWDAWCSAAMVEAQGRWGVDFAGRYHGLPPRRFLLPPSAEKEVCQVGCLFASADRVGRSFPFVLGLARSMAFAPMEAEAVAGRLTNVMKDGLARWDSLEELAQAAEAAIGDDVATSQMPPLVDPRQPEWIAQMLDEGED